MKATVLHGINDLRIEDIQVPELANNEVLVNVKACGICGSDVGRALKTGAYHYPIVIGHEFAGTVTKVENINHDRWIGRRVGIFPLKPCFSCKSCNERKYEMCESYDYLGSRCNGGFEEFVAVPEWNLIELPDNVSYEEAAMLEPLSVAIHALRDFDKLDGKTVVIIGPGPIGNLISRVAKAKGASRIIMTGRTAAKPTFAPKYGSDHVIDSATQNVKQEIDNLTDGNGADIVVEGTGASSSVSTAIQAVRRSGSVILLGNPSEDIAIDKATYWQILRKQIKLIGTWNSSFKSLRDDWQEAVNMISSGKIDLKPLISHTLPFDELRQGLEIMMSKDTFSNKVMLVNNE